LNLKKGLLFLISEKRIVIVFKAGSELSSSVNRMDVVVNEDITDEALELKITLVLILFCITVCSYPKVAISKHFTVNHTQTLKEAQRLI
jgi:hypothetical protein